ncbi:MAG: adenosine deaminase [Elusimicrobiota bacterium]|nr:adenosine deaminase [Elusimicrobiota bacterium]
MKVAGETLVKFPKVDLHCHLDGSIRPETIFDIMKAAGAELPCDVPADIADYVQVDSSCRSLTDFLSKFEFFYPYLKSPESMERIAYELCEDAAKENIRYMEVRFAPCLQASEKVTQEDILKSVLAGFKKGERDFDIKTGSLLCAYRGTPGEDWEETYSLAEKFAGRGVCGMDLAGDESRFPGAPFAAIFDRARDAGIPVTIHAGEAAGWESVKEAVDVLHASRIGHGVRMAENNVFFNRMKDVGVVFEVCVTSNVQTGVCADYKSHPLADFYKKGIKTTINTDDRGVSNIDLTHEWNIVQTKCGLEIEDVLDMNIFAVEAAFCPDDMKNILKNRIQKETRDIMSGFSG